MRICLRFLGILFALVIKIVVSSSNSNFSNYHRFNNNRFKPKYTFMGRRLKDEPRSNSNVQSRSISDSWNAIKDSLKFAVPCFDTQNLISKNKFKFDSCLWRSFSGRLRFKGQLQGALIATIMAGLIDQDVIKVENDYKRVGLALLVSTIICFDYKIQECFNDSKDSFERCHERSAKKLQELFQKNAGIYIKAGQHLSSMDHILPQSYVKRMATLQDQAKVTDFESIKQLFQEEFNFKLEDVFSEIDEDPIGSASIGQVHVGQLKSSGQPVAIKIQHPNIEIDSKIDLKTLKIILKLIKVLFPNFDFVWIVDELEESLKFELNFLEEAKNAERSRGGFERSGNSRVVIPKVYEQFTSRRVLTMEYCPGIKITDKQTLLKSFVDPKQVTKLLYEIFMEMIFVHKFLHCDPHPGNILIAPSSNQADGSFKIILLDHGIYKDLSDKIVLNFSQCYLAIFKDNQEELEKVAGELNISAEVLREFKVFLGDLRTTLRNPTINNNTADTATTTKIRSDISSYLSLNEESSIKFCELPHEFLLLFKIFDLLRSTERKLNPSVSLESLHSFLLLNQYCTECVKNGNRNGDNGGKLNIYPNWCYINYWKLLLFIYFNKK